MKVFNLSGQVVDVITNGFYNENQYSFTWDGSGLPSGLYVIDANFNGMSRTHNVSLIK